jgi:hypothetical protein
MHQPGKIELSMEGEALECKDATGNPVWQCPVPTIVLIAEYTTDQGPLFDDYFLVFWSWEDSKLFRSQVTCYANGRDAALAGLSRYLRSELKLGLADSTDWKSRIVWPPDLADVPYFTFVEEPPRNWRERLRRRIWGPTKTYFTSDDVCRYLCRYDSAFSRQV